MSLLNLGILAHVDAGKTSLTERLLHAAGVIDEIGRVDDGTTQTDSLALERQRGITIKSAVVSFAIGDTTVNLIDTPGHPDFIAEVERVLSVLDGAVLVVSAVEGVQAQTRVLMRTLRRLGIPTLIFINKIDRRGADAARVLREIADKLTPSVVRVDAPADTLTEALAEHSDDLLAAFVAGEPVPHQRLNAELATQTRKVQVHPVFTGSAMTGAGVAELSDGIVHLLPKAGGDPDGPVSGTVFKVERGAAGEKIAYVRMFGGTLRTRDRVPTGPEKDGKVTAISVFDSGSVVRGVSVGAGRIGKVWGLTEIRIGDTVGEPHTTAQHPVVPVNATWQGRRHQREQAHHFPPPTLETVVVPRRARDRGALHSALTQLAEQDPLINVRLDEVRQEISVSLYGEVQKEVIQATLADEFDVAVTFEETTTICLERPSGTGEAVEFIDTPPNPFLATVGLRIEPAAVGSGVSFQLGVELGSMPYAFFVAVEETLRETLTQGIHGWQVTDCLVTMTHSGYWPRQSHAHQKFDKSMSSTAGDFRNLTRLVVMDALTAAGSTVFEPMHRFTLEVPADTFGAVLPALVRLGAIPRNPEPRGAAYLLTGAIPAASVHELEQRLPGWTRGEGVLDCEFDHYQEVTGAIPERSRTDQNPLDRKEYLLRVMRRV